MRDDIDQPAPILIIGIDACDADLLQRWAGEGRLPFLASLMESGAYGRLSSTRNLFADAPWPSLNAGVSPAKHAFYNHLQLRRGTTLIDRVSAHDCRYLPFWSALRGTGRRVTVLDVPKTFPIDGVDGVQISGWGEHYPLLPTPTSIPPEAVAQIISRFGAFPHPPEIPRRLPFARELEVYHTLSASIEKQRLAIEHLMRSTQWDLFFSVFSSAHYGGHQFQADLDPGHWAHRIDAPPELKEALPRLLARTDEALRTVFEQAPSDANCFVVSVHGIETNFSANHLMPRVLEGLGYLGRSSESADANLIGRLVRWSRPLREAIPASIRRMINDRFIPESVHDRAFSSEFSCGTNWEQTRAFLLPSDHFQALISINLKGREPGGIVDPADYDTTCREIAAELRKLTNGATAKPAVADVVCVADVYDGPNRHELPDLVVQWEKEGPIESLRHPRLGEVSEPGFELRRSQHAPDGWVIARGPQIASGASLTGGATVDFAPTVLYLMGQPIPEEIDGSVWLDLIDERFKRDNAPRMARGGVLIARPAAG